MFKSLVGCWFHGAALGMIRIPFEWAFLPRSKHKLLYMVNINKKQYTHIYIYMSTHDIYLFIHGWNVSFAQFWGMVLSYSVWPPWKASHTKKTPFFDHGMEILFSTLCVLWMKVHPTTIGFLDHHMGWLISDLTGTSLRPHWNHGLF